MNETGESGEEEYRRTDDVIIGGGLMRRLLMSCDVLGGEETSKELGGLEEISVDDQMFHPSIVDVG